MTTATIREQAVRPAASQLRRYRALAVIGAGLAAVAVWTVAVLVLGVELHVSTGRGESGVRTIGPASVTAVSLLVSLLGWGLLALLERRTARARRIWTIIAFGVLLLSRWPAEQSRDSAGQGVARAHARGCGRRTDPGAAAPFTRSLPRRGRIIEPVRKCRR